MATFGTVGLEEVENLLLNMDEKATAAVPLMIKAGAEVIVEAQRAEAQQQGINDTGGFAGSIKPTNIKGSGNEQHVLVYPQGTAQHGNDYTGKKGSGKSIKGNVRYATIGFMNEVGTSKQPARPWFTAANEKAGDKANEKMAEVWEGVKNG